MKRLLLLLSLYTLVSCERHKQEVVIPPAVEAQVIDLNAIDELNTAILQNDYRRVENTLNDNNLNIDVVNEQGKLLLNEAIKLERLLIGELLIFYGANPDSVDQNEQSARELIQESIHIDEWKLVLDGGSVTGDYVTTEAFTLVSEAAIDNQRDKINTLEIYVEKGLDLNYVNSNNLSLLMIATDKNLIEMVNFLCSIDSLDPNLTVVVVRRRREYQITARFYAKTPEATTALDRCGVN